MLQNCKSQVGEEVAVFVDIELYVKYGEAWSRPIPGTGGDMLASKERGGIYVSDECYKKATTDAISVACKQLGIGADVYWEADRAEGGRQSSSAPKNPGIFPGQDARSSPPGQHKGVVLETKYINSLLNELVRTGVGKNSLLHNYGKKDIGELSFAEYKDAMNKLCSKPNKADNPLDPRFIPPDDKGDPNSPWNSGREKTGEEGKIAPVQEAGSADRTFSSAHPKGNPLPADLVAEGYTYCGSFGGN